MAFYENTLVAKQDLAEKEIKTIKDKYNDIIKGASGKVIKMFAFGNVIFIKVLHRSVSYI